MPLGMEVGLGPSDFVLDGDPAPHPKRGQSRLQFSAHVLWPSGYMDQDATWLAAGVVVSVIRRMNEVTCLGLGG